MKAEIKKETDTGFGLLVTDNNEVEHKIGVQFDGHIDGHLQDGYHDEAAKRTDEENEHVNQARKFARYYVYMQRGYDTVPPSENPVRIDAVRQAIAEMDLDTFEAHFGDLYQQLAYENGDAAEPALDVPPEASDPTIYAQDVYLGIDPLETDLGQTLAAEHGLDVTDESASDLELSNATVEQAREWGEFAGDFTVEAAAEGLDLSETAYVDESSALYVKYPDGPQLSAVDDHLEPRGRDPDTVIELLPLELESLEYFQSFMDHYLRCQIRDCFVCMGVTPPEKFQVLGMGQFVPTTVYVHVDFYPEFHNPDSEAFSEKTGLF